MNKKDMERDAQRLEEMGVDPSTVFAYTLEEWASMHGDEVDNFDEIKEELKNIDFEIDECSLEIDTLKKEVKDLNDQINDKDQYISELHDRQDKTRNWSERVDLNEFIEEEEKERSALLVERNQKQAEIDRLIAKREELAKKLASLKAAIEKMFQTDSRYTPKSSDNSEVIAPAVEEDASYQTTMDEIEQIESVEEALENKTIEIDGYAFEIHTLNEEIDEINRQVIALLEQRKAKSQEIAALTVKKEQATAEYLELEQKRKRF